MIYFAYEPDSRSVIIGPVVASGKSGKAPSALEHGRRVALPSGPIVNIDARPYMGPSFEKELQNLPAIWKSVIK